TRRLATPVCGRWRNPDEIPPAWSSSGRARDLSRKLASNALSWMDLPSVDGRVKVTYSARAVMCRVIFGDFIIDPIDRAPLRLCKTQIKVFQASVESTSCVSFNRCGILHKPKAQTRLRGEIRTTEFELAPDMVTRFLPATRLLCRVQEQISVLQLHKTGPQC